MPWREGLLPDQVRAARHAGSHARLLAGPGTGKTRTLTRRVLALILDHGVEPRGILALTFTRVAAYQLRQEIQQTLGPLGIDTPRVSTLHSFALRQLLRNSDRIQALPQPLRIADDWEERHIIQEDITERLQRPRIREVQDLFKQLSADWETLRRDDPNWEVLFPDPAFLGAWQEHRRIFGYTLRAELVYQVRRALNQYPDFDLEDDFRYVLVDEYQDLNACDLEVIRELAARGCEIYATGDDDQSIYGFRYADPQGIRRFTKDYHPSVDLSLEICHRCDHSILRIAEFVASLDVDRLRKNTRARDNAAQGDVHLFCFADQYQEARAIARLCRYLAQTENVKPDEILILLRSDRHQALSSVLQQALAQEHVAVAEYGEFSPLDTNEGRIVLAILRLLVDANDNLAWRTALQLRRAIGSSSLRAVQDWARSNNARFAAAVQALKENPEQAGRVGRRIAQAVTEYEALLEQLSQGDPVLDEQIQRTARHAIVDEEQRERVVSFLSTIAEGTGAKSLNELVNALSASLHPAEQELVEGAVNIMTMHKAKGLSADVVFIVGAEDEFIPGRNEGQREGDERRLLFVSMTRARHRLFVSYCRRRIRHQAHLGRESGRPDRSLTRFLRDAPIRVEDGAAYVSRLVR
jgi:DNA helicase-2/ATP-dependent DNA helicase PcrA